MARKQTSQIYYGGNYHHEIYFNGMYHDAMYVGDQLVWKKLDGPGPRPVPKPVNIFGYTFDTNSYVISYDESNIYMISNVDKSELCGISPFTISEKMSTTGLVIKKYNSNTHKFDITLRDGISPNDVDERVIGCGVDRVATMSYAYSDFEENKARITVYSSQGVVQIIKLTNVGSYDTSVLAAFDSDGTLTILHNSISANRFDSRLIIESGDTRERELTYTYYDSEGPAEQYFHKYQNMRPVDGSNSVAGQGAFLYGGTFSINNAHSSMYSDTPMTLYQGTDPATGYSGIMTRLTDGSHMGLIKNGQKLQVENHFIVPHYDCSKGTPITKFNPADPHLVGHRVSRIWDWNYISDAIIASSGDVHDIELHSDYYEPERRYEDPDNPGHYIVIPGEDYRYLAKFENHSPNVHNYTYSKKFNVWFLEMGPKQYAGRQLFISDNGYDYTFVAFINQGYSSTGSNQHYPGACIVYLDGLGLVVNRYQANTRQGSVELIHEEDLKPLIDAIKS